VRATSSSRRNACVLNSAAPITLPTASSPNWSYHIVTLPFSHNVRLH
jgi:hypothetical protein